MTMKAKQIASIRKIYTDKNCAFCGWMKSAVSWWCSNESAIKARKTRIPGVCHCPYWKPDKNYILEHLIEN